MKRICSALYRKPMKWHASMRRRNISLAALCLVLLLVGMAPADMSKWVAEREWTQESRKSDSKSNVPVSISVESRQRGSPEVELYTTSWCRYCEKAREFFRSRNIPFTEYDIEKDKSAGRRKQKLDPAGGVPFAMVNGQAIRGFSETAYARALEGTR